MIPPPAMTTSALSMPVQAPELEDQLQSGKGCDVSIVERRRHLDHVQAHQLRARCGDAQKVESLPGGEPAGRWDLRPGREGGVEGVDVERDVHALAVERLGDRARCRRVAYQLRSGHQQHASSADEIKLFGVVVASAGDDHAGGADARNLECPAHSAAAGPASAAREIAQVWMCIDPQHGEIGVAPSLGGKSGDGRAVVSTQDGQKRRGRHFRQPVGHLRPAGLDVGAGVQVAHVVHLEPGKWASILGDGRHDCREVTDALRGQGGALAIDGRAVVGDAGDDDVGRLYGVSRQPTPGLEPLQVHLSHDLRITGTFFSGTLRIRRPPSRSQMKKTVNMTGYPPGRPRMLGPLLNSSRNPPTKRAMTPEPAVAMLLKPMKSPASPEGMPSWMNAAPTEKKSPYPIPIKTPTRVAWAARTGTFRACASGSRTDPGNAW